MQSEGASVMAGRSGACPAPRFRPAPLEASMASWTWTPSTRSPWLTLAPFEATVYFLAVFPNSQKRQLPAKT